MHALHRSAVALTLAACASLTLAAPHARADATGADIVGYVNAQRAANGIPAGIVEDTAASAACATWDGGDHPNGSSPTLPPASSITWQGQGVLAANPAPWTATNDPFENDWIYLPEVLAPRLASFGAAEVAGVGCATLHAPGTRPAPTQDVAYTYPGDGVQDSRTSQPLVTSGWSGNPQDPTLSMGGSHTRGPVLYAFFDGPDFDPAHPATAHATTATLTGPDGAPLALDVRDATTPPYSTASMPTEVQLVPHDGLKPFTKYTASVAADVTLPAGGPARSFTRTWSFTTGALENMIEPLSAAHRAGIDNDPSAVTVSLFDDAPIVTATATGPGTPASATSQPTLDFAGEQFVTLHLDRPGAWHICLRSGGPGTDYRPASACLDATGGATPKAATPVTPVPIVPKPRVTRVVASLAHGVHARLHGRTLSVPLRCSKACTLKVAAKVTAKGRRATPLRAVTVARKSAGTLTAKYTLSKAAARRLRTARSRRLALTIVPKGGATVRKTVAISAK